MCLGVACHDHYAFIPCILQFSPTYFWGLPVLFTVVGHTAVEGSDLPGSGCGVSKTFQSLVLKVVKAYKKLKCVWPIL
jgi:hypothetical protein